MSGFRAKFIILLIVYFAGFATAVYFFTPVSQQNNISVQTDPDHSFTTNWFIRTLNTGLHGAVDITKTVTYNVSTYIRQKNNDPNQIQKTGS